MGADEYDLPERVSCPFCDGDETELHSPFGTALSVATYWCRTCRTAFEWVKWKEPEPGSTGASGAGGE
ncbi:MAG: PaaD-like zinc ribbon domain-containing protein [Candidatus Longimicrobiales bacterium M2_2A_002]